MSLPSNHVINTDTKQCIQTQVDRPPIETEELDWDADDFELPVLDAPKPPSKPGDVVDISDGGDAYWEEEEQQKSLDRKTTKEKGAPAEGMYLTKQFRSLNTPASKKKPRCMECTRPLPEGHKGRICDRCSS